MKRSWARLRLEVKRRVIAEAQGFSAHRSSVGGHPADAYRAPWLRPVLWALSMAYGAADGVLGAAYACGVLRAVRLPLPVISVGNVTWGGNGKTPMAIFLARLFRQRGLRPLVLTRGYGGDEDKLLCRHLAGVAGVGSGADRAAVAHHMLHPSACDKRPPLPAQARCMHLGEVAVGSAGSRGGLATGCGKNEDTPERRATMYDLVILDDGHQHRRMVRDSNILMINCLDSALVDLDPPRNGSCPRGCVRVGIGAAGSSYDCRQLAENACGGENACKWASLRLQGRLLPRGTLREPLERGLAKADVVVLHNADLIHPCQLAALHASLLSAFQSSRSSPSLKSPISEWKRSCSSSARAWLSSCQSGRLQQMGALFLSRGAGGPPHPPPIISTGTSVISTRPLLPRLEKGERVASVAGVSPSAGEWWLDGCDDAVGGGGGGGAGGGGDGVERLLSNGLGAAVRGPEKLLAGKPVVAVAALANPAGVALALPRVCVRARSLSE